MVNLAQRVAKFRPLIQTRVNAGSLVLPPAPAPQLTRLVISYPQINYTEQSPEIQAAIKKRASGAFHFAKEYLQGIKYHNPGVQVEARHYPGGHTFIEVELESPDRNALRTTVRDRKYLLENRENINAQNEARAANHGSRTGKVVPAGRGHNKMIKGSIGEKLNIALGVSTERQNGIEAAEPMIRAQSDGVTTDTAPEETLRQQTFDEMTTNSAPDETLQDQNFDDVNTSAASEEMIQEQKPRDAALSKPTHKILPAVLQLAPNKLVKVQPTPASQAFHDSTVPVYTRTVRFNVENKHSNDIYKWFKRRVGATQDSQVQMTDAEGRVLNGLEEKAVKSAEDRERALALKAIKDREKAELEEVRQAAERASAEVAGVS